MHVFQYPSAGNETPERDPEDYRTPMSESIYNVRYAHPTLRQLEIPMQHVSVATSQIDPIKKYINFDPDWSLSNFWRNPIHQMLLLLNKQDKNSEPLMESMLLILSIKMKSLLNIPTTMIGKVCRNTMQNFSPRKETVLMGFIHLKLIVTTILMLSISNLWISMVLDKLL